MRPFLLMAFVLLGGAACAPPYRGSGSLDQGTIPYLGDGNGLQLLDRPLRVDFGRTDHSAIAAMTKIEASQPVAEGVCQNGLRFATWRSGMSLIFDDVDFVGWAKDGQKAGAPCLRVT